MEKKFCTVHHLYYNGVECPLCLSERIGKIEKKYNSWNTDEKTEKEEVTGDMLENLKLNFGSK